MTAVPAYCVGRGCPGEADADGFCRRSGFACPAFEKAPATGPAAGPATGFRRVTVREPTQAPAHLGPLSAQRHRSTPTLRRHAGPSNSAWERAVVIPSRPAPDVGESIAPEVVVPAHLRRCTNHHQIAGSRPSGFCPKCGAPYAFRPSLAAGNLLAGRYQIERCLAYGGLGWVYLARDKEMVGKRRVLKGLRNPHDPQAAQAFAAEMGALVELDHANVVSMTHVVPPQPGTTEVYLAMEYVDGGTLEQIRAAAGPDGRPAAIDVGQVLEFGDEILDALGYLHDHGWLYCDLKPENIMRSGARIKIVDFGAVRRIDDRASAPWGSAGFQAPEVDREGPAATTIQSDVFTVGRTLGALALAESTADFLAAFPVGVDWRTVAVPTRLDPFVRLIARATATGAAARFGTAAEMREQVAGVRRQVEATDDRPQPARSEHFGPFRRAFDDHVDPDRGLDPVHAALGLPLPLVDGADPAAGYLASIGAAEPDEVLVLLEGAPQRSPEVVYREVRTLLATGDTTAAAALLEGLPRDRTRWRHRWYRGLVALVDRDFAAARGCFDAVYGWLPGEVSARLGYAVACELDGAAADARDHYEAVWRTDRAVDSAAFGLARTLLVRPRSARDLPPGPARDLPPGPLREIPQQSQRGNAGPVTADSVDQAVAVLGQIEGGSHASTAAGIWRVRLLLGAPPGPARERRLRLAADIAGRLALHGRDWELMKALVLQAAVDSGLTDTAVLGCPAGLNNLRRELERAWRSLASGTTDRRERIMLVDLANRYRPMSWL